jgi:uncharacterized protein (DUF58 family)
VTIFKKRLTEPFATTSQATDSPVEVTAKTLIALHREAKGVSLKPSRIRSAQSGKYISPYIGRGMTFAESRPYQAGDDARHMDWRVTARTGKAYTKLFQEERERSILVWVDFRSTMFFATRGRFKSVQAARAAAWIAWAAKYNNDRIGGLIFSDHQHWELRPKTGDKAVLRLIHCLCEAAGTAGRNDHLKKTNPQKIMAQALVRLRLVVKPGSQIFLLSDFRNLDKTGEAHLQQLARHNELVLISHHDALEESLPVPGLYPVDFGTGNQILNTRTTGSRQQYESQFKNRQEYLKNLCRKLRGHFLNISTQEEITTTLQTTFQS